MKPTNFTKRSQLQVDASPHTKQQLKKLAAEQGVSVRVMVLRALGSAYPALAPYVRADLKE